MAFKSIFREVTAAEPEKQARLCNERPNPAFCSSNAVKDGPKI
jgi:hypothetical protein